MNAASKLIVVNSDVLPDVFIKVIEVKKLLARGEEKSSALSASLDEAREALEEKRSTLLTELDTQIKVSNATTFIEVA